MSITDQYTASASRATSTVESLTDFWAQAVRVMSSQTLTGLPRVNLVPAAERYFQLVQQGVEISRTFTIKWAEAATMMSDALREQMEAMGGLAQEQADSARDLVHYQADQAKQAVREQAAAADRAGQELASQTHETADRAERETRRAGRQANDKPVSAARS
jgi:hypothetical protein